MDPKFQELFNLVKANEDLKVFAGDDVHMGSMPPYGISSGLAQLDLHLGRKGGLPASKVIEYFGAQFCGKTTAALQAAAEWQKRGGLVVFIDTEKSFDIGRAMELGVNVENVFKHEADTIEDVFATISHYVGEIEIEGKGVKRKSKPGVLNDFKEPVLFIVDSITGVPSRADVQGDMNESDRPGFEAKQIKRGIKKINPLLGDLDCKPTIIFINHAYSKIGRFPGQESSGGRGIKYYASVRVQFAHGGNETEGSDKKRTGQTIYVTIEKLKGGHLEYPRFRAELTNETGFDKNESLLEAMVLTNYVKRPASSKTITILPGDEKEEQIRTTDWNLWIEQKGYEEAYLAWRKWCIENASLAPWGSV